MRRALSWVVVILVVGAIFVAGLIYGFTLLNRMKISLEDAKTVSDILFTLVQTIAVVIAAIWTYQRFIKNREDYPYPDVSHRLNHFKLENGYTYLSVFVTVKNAGKTKLDLSVATIFVRKVLPVSKRINDLIVHSDPTFIRQAKNMDESNKLFIDQGRRISWETIGDRVFSDTLEQDRRKKMQELEPGQKTEIQFDFLFKDRVDVVELISQFKFRKSVWDYATLHSFKESDLQIQDTD